MMANSQLPYVNFPSTTVVIILPFFVIFVVFVRSAERERCVDLMLDGDDERCDVRDDGLGNEFRPSFTLNFTLNIVFVFFLFLLFSEFDFTFRILLIHF